MTDFSGIIQRNTQECLYEVSYECDQARQICQGSDIMVLDSLCLLRKWSGVNVCMMDGFLLKCLANSWSEV